MRCQPSNRTTTAPRAAVTTGTHGLAGKACTKEVAAPAPITSRLSTCMRCALVLDCGFLPGNDEAARLAGALRLSAHILGQRPDQLCFQLCGRLVEEDGPQTARLLAGARACVAAGVAIPQRNGFLDRPGALIRIF